MRFSDNSNLHKILHSLLFLNEDKASAWEKQLEEKGVCIEGGLLEKLADESVTYGGCSRQ